MPSDSDSGSSSSSSSSSSDEDERFLPKSRKGWQGEDLELEHQRESFRQHKEKQVAAVDISQFQNTEVGKGYQAKHVVRQQQAEKKTVEIQDRTRKRTREDAQADTTTTKVRDNPKTRLQKYLASPGFVMFRKEIEDICSS